EEEEDEQPSPHACISASSLEHPSTDCNSLSSSSSLLHFEPGPPEPRRDWPGHWPGLNKKQLGACTFTSGYLWPDMAVGNLKKGPRLNTVLSVFAPVTWSGVEIRQIANPLHPANGAYGLFATRAMPAGKILGAYSGAYFPRVTKSDSAYIAALEGHPLQLSVDALEFGNEARFINDFHGVPQSHPGAVGEIATEANCAFRLRMHQITGLYYLEVFTKSHVSFGEELLFDYGPKWWSIMAPRGFI
ncbi:MAG: hypothetical protein Q8P67_04045, partial [archaeon]|nr:hypothetical protein [archaeon]